MMKVYTVLNSWIIIKDIYIGYAVLISRIINKDVYEG